MLPYIQNPLLKKVGISLFLIGVLGSVGIGLTYHYSGKVVATAETTKPLPQTDLAQQSLQAQSQALLNNKMNEMGVPVFRTDKLEKLEMVFTPVYLSADMGELDFELEIHTRGIVSTENVASAERTFKTASYELLSQTTGKTVFKNTLNHIGPHYADENGNTGKIIYNAVPSKVKMINGLQYVSAGRVQKLKDGEYVFQAKIEKLKYVYPIDSIKLIVRKDRMPLSDYKIFGGLIACIIAGYFLCYLTIPPESRRKKRAR